jgi:serine/threonine protein kinase/Tfp pilus assembly protein PilF
MSHSTDNAGIPTEHRPPPGAQPADFAAARSLKRELLDELRTGWETGTAVRPEDLLPRWPGNPECDPDVASLLFEEYCQRQQKGDEPAPEEYERRFPAHKDFLAGLLQHQAVVRSVSGGSSRSDLTLALPTVGDEVFGFRLRYELGRGAFARVYLGEETALAGRPVVLKVSGIDGDEPQTLAQLQHTHIVPIYSFHEDPRAGLRVVCMPFFGGASLSHVLQVLWAENERPTRGEQLVRALAVAQCPSSAVPSQSSLTPSFLPQVVEGGPRARLAGTDYVRAVAWVMARLAEALQHAHQRGVLHRDIKPSNILLGADGQPMLLDFNLARNLNCPRATAAATLGGTVAYMAPEHLRALAARDPALARQVDHRADIYGLGMVLYEMLVGHGPFDQSASYSPLPAIIEAMAVERSRNSPSLRGQRPDVPWDLESIARTCLAADPDQRYQQAEHLAEDLRRFLEDRPLKHAPELSWAERGRKWARRHPRLAGAASVAAVATLLLTAGSALLAGTRQQLQAAHARAEEAAWAEARQRKQAFEEEAFRALCLVNTTADVHDHVSQGLAVCEGALALYDVLQRDDGQGQAAWARLEPTERQSLAEDARELLLLMARARVHLAPRTADPHLPQTLAAFLTPLAPAAVAAHLPGSWSAGQAVWGPRVEGLTRALASAHRQALALLDRAETIQELSASPALWEDRAFYLEQLGDNAAAEAARERARTLPRSGARDHHLLATTYARNRRYPEAVAELTRALRCNPRHYWSWMQRGLCHQELGDYAQAGADFTACIALWPEFAWGYFNAGRICHQLGRLAAAADHYTGALERDTDFVPAYLNRGLVYLDLKRAAEALADFDAAAARGRDDVVLHGGRGLALESLGRFPEADRAFQQAWARDANHVAMLLGYGFAVCRRRPEDARAAFGKVLARDPRNPRALYGQAMLLAERTRSSGAALELFNRALEVDPTFVAARRGRAIVLAHRGAWDEARQDIDWSVAAEPTGVTLYAAACVYALAAANCPDTHMALPLAHRAVACLREALARGYGQDKALEDADLAGIRGHPEFRRLLESAVPPAPPR